MARARIKDHDRWLGRVETVFKAIVTHAGNAKQSVVGRPFEPASIENELVVEIEKRRLASPFVCQHVVSTLA